jgi:hypothetical protein
LLALKKQANVNPAVQGNDRRELGSRPFLSQADDALNTACETQVEDLVLTLDPQPLWDDK